MLDVRVQELIEKCASAKGVAVVDAALHSGRKSTVLEVFIDAAGGVTSDVCAEVSRELGAALEAGNLIEGPYRLEVSSPGVDRPLKFPWQYSKHVGRRIHCRLRSDGGSAELAGKLVSVDAAGVTVQGEGGGVAREIPFAEIIEARIRTPW